MTCDWELYMGASLSSLASRDFGSCSLELSENRGGLNRSMQHWLAVYSPGFQSPRFFAVVD
jgi:hypothetical protein